MLSQASVPSTIRLFIPSFVVISACNNCLQKRRFELLLVASSVFEALQPAIPTTHLLQTCSQGVAQPAASNLLCCSCESPRDRSCYVAQHSGSPTGTCILLLIDPVLLQRPASCTGITSQQSTRCKPPSHHELAHCSLCMSLTLNAHISPRWLYMLSERVSQLIVACVCSKGSVIWARTEPRHAKPATTMVSDSHSAVALDWGVLCAGILAPQRHVPPAGHFRPRQDARMQCWRWQDVSRKRPGLQEPSHTSV